MVTANPTNKRRNTNKSSKRNIKASRLWPIGGIPGRRRACIVADAAIFWMIIRALVELALRAIPQIAIRSTSSSVISSLVRSVGRLRSSDCRLARWRRLSRAPGISGRSGRTRVRPYRAKHAVQASGPSGLLAPRMSWPLDCFVARAPRNDGWVAADPIDCEVVGRRLSRRCAVQVWMASLCSQ